MDSITLVFKHEKDTKNTRRFQEVVADDAAPIIGTLYVTKHVTTDDEFTVTLAPKAAKKRGAK
jgi:hypothetical protein